jgi:hypothetical protein
MFEDAELDMAFKWTLGVSWGFAFWDGQIEKTS